MVLCSRVATLGDTGCDVLSCAATSVRLRGSGKQWRKLKADFIKIRNVRLVKSYSLYRELGKICISDIF
jgi:hypothetical protein